MRITNHISLIGDALNTMPIMKALAPCTVEFCDENKWMVDILPEGVTEGEGGQELDLHRAFRTELHMTQAYHEQFGLPVPEHPIRPNIRVPYVSVPTYDFIFAPFSRSLPDEQKWAWFRWQELGWDLQERGYKVAILGNSKYDNAIFGITNEFDRPLTEVFNLLQNCRHGVVTVVTGISHMCYATGTKNYLLTNQGVDGWGINPDAIKITTDIPELTVNEVLECIKP